MTKLILKGKSHVRARREPRDREGKKSPFRSRVKRRWEGLKEQSPTGTLPEGMFQ